MLLNLIDKAKNADLYKQLGDYITKVEELQNDKHRPKKKQNAVVARSHVNRRPSIDSESIAVAPRKHQFTERTIVPTEAADDEPNVFRSERALGFVDTTVPSRTVPKSPVPMVNGASQLEH